MPSCRIKWRIFNTLNNINKDNPISLNKTVDCSTYCNMQKPLSKASEWMFLRMPSGALHCWSANMNAT